MEYSGNKHYKVYALQGASMYPALRDGDRVVVSARRRPRVGDVIVYKKDADDVFVAHRVVKITADAFIAKGDNSLCCDRAISHQDALGVVLYVIRGNAIRRFKRGTVLGRLWFLSSACVLFKEKFIKMPFGTLQKTPVYRHIFSRLLPIDYATIEIKKEVRRELVFKFYSKKRYLAVARLDKQNLDEKVFYVRFFYRGIGLEQELRTRLAQEVNRIKEANENHFS